MSNPIEGLRARGQSIWLDYIQRGLITSGRLAEMINSGWVSGITSNPSIFNKAISGSSDYSHDLAALSESGIDNAYEAFVAMGGEDIRMAATALAHVYEGTEGRDGFVSLEVPPALARDYEATVDEAERLFGLIGAPNTMIKVPATPEGVRALEELIYRGLNINQTLLFDVDVYEASAEAYISGLERRIGDDLPVDRIASVASFFVSRVDAAVDSQLPESSELRGKAAIANTCAAYEKFITITQDSRWAALAANGARVQRPLWASTSTKNPDYPDTLYVDELVAPDTVNTLPEATLEAFADHGNPDGGIDPTDSGASEVLAALAEAGIDMKAVTDKLLIEGLDAFASDFEKLLDLIAGELAGSTDDVPEAGD